MKFIHLTIYPYDVYCYAQSWRQQWFQICTFQGTNIVRVAKNGFGRPSF